MSSDGIKILFTLAEARIRRKGKSFPHFIHRVHYFYPCIHGQRVNKTVEMCKSCPQPMLVESPLKRKRKLNSKKITKEL